MANHKEKELDALYKELSSINEPEPTTTIRDPFAAPEGINPSVLEEINKSKTSIVNNEAKSPNLMTKEELVKTAPAKEKSQLEKLLEKSNNLRSKSSLEMKAARENDRRNAMITNVANALGNLGASQVQRTVGTKVGLKPFEVTKAEDTASRIGKDRDSLLAQLRDEYKLSQLGKEKPMSYYQKASLDLRKQSNKNVRDKLDLLKGKEGRLTEKDKFQKEVKNRLSDKEVESINSLNEGNRILDNIDDLLKNSTMKEDLGPYTSRLEEFSKYIPGMERSSDFVKAQQLVGIQLADYIKSISGTAVSAAEAERLLANIPNMTDKPKSFKDKLDVFRKEIQDSRRDYLKIIQKQKSGASKFLDKKEAASSKKQGYTDSQETGISSVMKNNNISRERAIKALKNAGKL